MGIESIEDVLKGVKDNYEIDILKEMISDQEEEKGVKDEGDLSERNSVIEENMSDQRLMIEDGVMK